MKYTRHSVQKTTSIFYRLPYWSLFCFIIIFILGIYTKSAHASLISFISKLIVSPAVSAKTEYNVPSSNLQTIALLQGAIHLDPNPDKQLESVPISSNSVLIPDMAVSGDYVIDNPKSTEISTYIVRSGDTISGIADMFGVSVSTVLWANDLTSRSVLKTGQTLVILPITGIVHTIQKGDSIGSISRKYKSDVDDILVYNDITLDSTLITGQEIIIPYAEFTPSTVSNIAKKTNNSSSGPNISGYFIRPVSGVRSQGLHGHNGIDIAAPIGTPIYASAAGTVIVSKSGAWNGGYGNFVIISHSNGTQTLYAHNTKNIVSAGEYVVQGQQIATVGSTGKSTGSHLHFEVRGAKNPF